MVPSRQHSSSVGEPQTRSTYFDGLETLEPEVRERHLMGRLPAFLGHAKSNSPTWALRLEHVETGEISSREALAQLPVLRKADIAALQADTPPFGGLTTRSFRELPRLFMSPGGVFEPQGLEQDPWRTARALWAAGVRPGHVLQNCFSYHLTPGAWLVDAAARSIGAAVIPAGIGNTEQQIQAMYHLKPEIYVGTPSFLRIIIEKSREASEAAPLPRMALVSGEALPTDLRAWFQGQGVAAVRQWYGTADAGTIAYESMDNEGMVVEEDVIVEIVKPGTGDPVADGEVGEVVVTNFNHDYPLIRFATGDLSAVLPGVSACGRTNMRIRGWLGRADDGAKVRGMFVYPMHVQQILSRLDFIGQARFVIGGEMGRDELMLECELKAAADGPNRATLMDQIAEACRSTTKLRVTPVILPPGSFNEDRRLLIDTRRLN